MGPRTWCWSYYWAKASNRAVVRFTGKELRVDEEGVNALADELNALGCPEVCLDLRTLEFVSTATLGVLLRLRRRLLERGRRLTLCPLPPRLAEVFAAARLDRLFEVYPPDEQQG